MFNLQFVGFVGLVATAACWGLAIVLNRVKTTGSVPRRLTALLVIEGLVLVTAGFPEFISGLPLDYWKSYYESHPALALLANLGPILAMQQ